MTVYKRVDRKYLKVLNVGWRCLEKISWTDRVKKKGKVLQIAKEERNILHATKGTKANRIGDILCWNCLLRKGSRREGRDVKSRKKT
jgi:hypothetical protein